MNLLVAGGAGFVGSHFVRATLAGRLPGLTGAAVTVLDRMTHAGAWANLGADAENARLHFLPGDVTDPSVVRAALRDHDAVLNFATDRRPGQAAAAATGAQVLLEAALRRGTGSFLQVSTAEVYGSAGAEPPTEQAPLRPSTPYAAGRAGADLLALAYHRSYGLPVVIARAGPTFGTHQHPGRFPARALTHLLDGRPVLLSGDGGRIRDWLHVDDLCRGVALALLSGRPGETYHLGGSVELTDRDLVGLLLAECGAGWDRVVGVAEPPGHDQRHALDDDKIRTELSWRPQVEFDAAVAATVRWYRANRDWWHPMLDD